jgi:heme oxygenase
MAIPGFPWAYMLGLMDTPLARLRSATAAAHQRVEGLPYGRSVMDGTVPVAHYASFLRAIDLIHGELLHALELSRDAVARGVLGSMVERRALLARDLLHLKADPLQVDAAALQALVLGQKMRLAGLQKPARLLGHAYVLEGSQLGGLVQQAVLQKRPELQGGGLAYLGSGSRKGFGEFAQRLGTALQDEAALAAAVEGAVEAFAGFEQILRAVDPLHADDMRLSQELNSDAGVHAVPDDLREIRAALRAGERSYREVAYYPARYGERGLAFIRSDSAWLATLSREGEHIHRQIDWIGRVLAARGMPRILLEQHLRILHDELGGADHAALRKEADWLRQQRESALPSFDALQAGYGAKLPTENTISGNEAAMLLLAAVADEKRGVPNAVSSLSAWLCDPKRFSPSWVAVTDSLLRAASGS